MTSSVFFTFSHNDKSLLKRISINFCKLNTVLGCSRFYQLFLSIISNKFKSKKTSRKIILRDDFLLLNFEFLIYFNFANAAVILLYASSIFSILFAKEMRMNFGCPNARPVTVDTCALFSKYMQRSSASFITSSPSFFPK